MTFKRTYLTPALLAVVAVMIAVTTLFTLAVRVPVPATGGYFNFSDVAVYFAAFAFGPWMGLVCGGIGTALADIIGGYIQFAPLTFLAHGLEGLVAGYVAHNLLPLTSRDPSPQRRVLGMLIGWALGGVVMLGFYFLGEAFVYSMGVIAAGEEALTCNIPQVIIGGLVGIPLVLAVRRAYPPITRIGQRREWREEG